MADEVERALYAHFPNGFMEQMRQTAGWLRHYGYSPTTVHCEGRADLPYNGVGAYDVMLPVDQIEGAKKTMRANRHG